MDMCTNTIKYNSINYVVTLKKFNIKGRVFTPLILTLTGRMTCVIVQNIAH